MAMLVSPGVSVTVTDESFFIPATAPTVPLLFIATADQKFRPDGVTPATGTYEHDVIETVTSVTQSTQLYGVPRFIVNSQGNPQHGDCRNEYGVFALNQFLGIGSKAYVIRANVNLDDDPNNIMAMWDSAVQHASNVMEQLIAARLQEYNNTNLYIPSNPLYKTTVTKTEFISDATSALQAVYDMYSFRNLEPLFQNDHSTAVCSATIPGFCVYANGFALPASGGYIGLAGLAAEWVANNSGSTTGHETEWTATEASALLIEAANSFKFTVEFLNSTMLGANDAARRVAIVQALQASINSNQTIRSDQYEFNLILCPGYPEVVDEMIALSIDINEEAFVIGETPMNMDPDALVSAWGDSLTSSRQHSNNVAYYYPHGLASNLDGADVMVAASGIALRTYAYSDNISQLWFAPAGTNRGLVSGVSQIGYVVGTLGSATTFVPTALNQGQRDNMYKYFTNINPIANLPGRGILVFGQKTSQGAASAMDRVNVSRLIKYIKRQLRKNTVPFLFEPNDTITQNNVKAVVDAFLQDILVKRGLYDFAVLCDSTNNTPDRIDRNELYVDIALKPTKAIEFIYIPIRILATGASM